EDTGGGVTGDHADDRLEVRAVVRLGVLHDLLPGGEPGELRVAGRPAGLQLAGRLRQGLDVAGAASDGNPGAGGDGVDGCVDGVGVRAVQGRIGGAERHAVVEDGGVDGLGALDAQV